MLTNQINSRGFTIVELVVVIATIGILAAITVLGFSAYQQDTRDAQRLSNSTTLSEALEKYYLQNGEYPTVPTIVRDGGVATAENVSTNLNIPIQAVTMPLSGNQLAITTRGQAVGDVVIYEAESEVNNENCQSSTNGGCDRFTLTYMKENGEEVVIRSRNDGAPVATVANPPVKPTVSLSSGGINIVEAGSSLANCSQNAARLVGKYSFRFRINSGAWTAWSTWATSNITSQTGTQGQDYVYEVKSRCDDGAVAGGESVVSDPDSYTIPINPPPTPTIAATLSGSSALATVAAASCPVGSTAEYAFRTNTNSGTYTAYSPWSTTRTSSVIASEGFRYGFQAQARCVATSTTSGAATTLEAIYIRPFTTPSAVSVSDSTSGNTTTFSIGDGSCPAGGTVQYQYRFRADWNYTSSWSGAFTTKPTPTWSTTSQGFEYFIDVQVRCSNVNTTSSWSAISSASYIRPVSNPSSTSFSGSRVNASNISLSATSTCGAGVYPDHRVDIHTWDWSWSPFPPSKLGWYRNHFGVWSINAMNYYGTTVSHGVTSANPIPSGTRWNIAVEKRCRNHTTGRVSPTFYQESPAYAL